MRYDAPQLLSWSSGPGRSMRVGRAPGLIWLDLISIRALLTPRYGVFAVFAVFAQQNASCWRCLFAELRKSNDTDTDSS